MIPHVREVERLIKVVTQSSLRILENTCPDTNLPISRGFTSYNNRFSGTKYCIVVPCWGYSAVQAEAAVHFQIVAPFFWYRAHPFVRFSASTTTLAVKTEYRDAGTERDGQSPQVPVKRNYLH